MKPKKRSPESIKLAIAKMKKIEDSKNICEAARNWAAYLRIKLEKQLK